MCYLRPRSTNEPSMGRLLKSMEMVRIPSENVASVAHITRSIKDHKGSTNFLSDKTELDVPSKQRHFVRKSGKIVRMLKN